MGGIYSEKGRNDSERSEQKGIETWMYIYRENTQCSSLTLFIFHTQAKQFFFRFIYFFPPEEK